MKHEFRATSRIVLPLFLVILVLSFFMAFVVRNGDNVSNPVLTTLYVIITAAYFISLAAVFIVLLVLMINRFRSNLLSDEGYVMFTLPVSVHQLVWSKIIVSCAWFAATIVVVGLSAFIVAFDMSLMDQFRNTWAELWQYLNVYYALNGTVIVIEALILFFFSYAAGCLQFYSAMAVGHSFDRRKTLMSVLFFFGFQFVLQFIVSVATLGFDLETYMNNLFYDFGAMSSIHLFFGLCILVTLIYGAVFYVITTQMLQKRLNIE
jgi:hypothetical protein